ncbi:MAG: nicotinamide-nucleotide amidase [Verrucomicrobiota bacterium]|nr:nicotinamide-nucleotide amidase [Verrucomicrobiota bacterium]
MSTAAEIKQLILRRPKLTLAAAESLTAGQIQARLASVSGSSEYFLGGVTAYALEQKVKLLGVNRAHAKAVNCVSQRVAVEMAAGACQLFGADLGVATTGYAEPSPAQKVRTPHAWWALCHRRRGAAVVLSGLIEVPGADRVTVQERVAEGVLSELVNYLSELRA